ncbi:MAG TPA: hypothetical protein VD905_20315, partial [Flavobacteriales bacterium]|nr:hypothetical protein [Flavobacteriales bacterium]
ENGQVAQERIFNEKGKPEKSIWYKPDGSVELIDTNTNVRWCVDPKEHFYIEPDTSKPVYPDPFPDGYQKIYNTRKKILMDGEFKNKKLYNGKLYKYDKNGLILKVEIYKNGKYFADEQLE